jgi:PPOX class probable F420-dependent enzyme
LPGPASLSGPASLFPEQAPVARLATVRPDGSPRLVPICFALDGDTLYSAVDEKPKGSRRLARLRDIERDPRVEILVDHYDEDWSRLWWVRLRGRARVVEHDERALALLCAKYPQYRRRPPAGPFLVVEVEERRAWRAEQGRS